MGVNTLRLAETVLRANGGFEVLLRMPGPAVSGQDGEQLGLMTPLFQDQPLGPAVWRKAGVNDGLIVAAAPVIALMGSAGFDSARALFQAASGVVVDGVFYTIADCEPFLAGGVACAYRLKLVAPVWD
jgi:hypothetical protein